MLHRDVDSSGGPPAPASAGQRGWLLALFALGVVACAIAVPVSALLRGVVRIGPASVAAGRDLRQPLLVIGGPVHLEGVNEAPIVVLGGTIFLDGRAEDDLVALPGDIVVASTAVAHGDVISLAGRILVAPGSDLTGSVIGQRTRLGPPEIVPQQTSLDFVVQRLRLAGLAISALLLLGLGVWTLLPWPALVTTATARRYRIWSIVLGFGTLVAAPLIVVPLAVSLAGLPLAALLALGLSGLWLIGVVSTAVRLGHRLLSIGHRPHSTLSAALAGLVCLGLLPALPVLGSVALLLAGCVGLGAAMLAVWDREAASELAVTQALAALRFPE
jgi:hypothetical protein